MKKLLTEFIGTGSGDWFTKSMVFSKRGTHDAFIEGNMLAVTLLRRKKKRKDRKG